MTNLIGHNYAEANFGALRNSDGSTYANAGVSVGTQQSLLLSNKDAIIGGAQISAGTAVQAKAMIGYERYLGNKSGLIFTANASIDKSLTKQDTFVSSTEVHMNINGQETNIEGIKVNTWKPGQIKFSGKALFNKVTSWGGYNAGIEAGYRKSLSPNVSVNQDINTSFELNGVSYSQTTHIESGREPKKGFFMTPTVSASVNLTKNTSWQLTGHADANDIRMGIKYNF